MNNTYLIVSSKLWPFFWGRRGWHLPFKYEFGLNTICHQASPVWISSYWFMYHSHINIFRNLVTINRQPDSSVPLSFLVQMSHTSIEAFLVATLVRKHIIQLNTVFLGKEITFYITENNNLFFLQYMMRISNNMKADSNTKLLRSIFLFCSYWVVEVSGFFKHLKFYPWFVSIFCICEYMTARM